MAEGYEENVDNLARATGMAYLEIRDAYKALPLPIVLPLAADGVAVTVLQQALLEAADRIEDLRGTVDELAATTLEHASMQLLSATALTELYIASHYPSHLAAAVWSIEQAVQLADLASTLLRQS